MAERRSRRRGRPSAACPIDRRVRGLRRALPGPCAGSRHQPAQPGGHAGDVRGHLPGRGEHHRGRVRAVGGRYPGERPGLPGRRRVRWTPAWRRPTSASFAVSYIRQNGQFRQINEDPSYQGSTTDPTAPGDPAPTGGLPVEGAPMSMPVAPPALGDSWQPRCTSSRRAARAQRLRAAGAGRAAGSRGPAREPARRALTAPAAARGARARSAHRRSAAPRRRCPTRQPGSCSRTVVDGTPVAGTILAAAAARRAVLIPVDLATRGR